MCTATVIRTLTEVTTSGGQVSLTLPRTVLDAAQIRRRNVRTTRSIGRDAVPGSVQIHRAILANGTMKIAWSWTSREDHSRNSLVKWIIWE